MHKLSIHFSPPLLTLSNPLPPPPSSDESSTIPLSDDPGPITTYYAFPPAHLLPVQMETLLRELGFGYRANFIESSLATLRAEFGIGEGDVERGLMSLRNGKLEDVREKLISLKGVGRKVADCVMLMCLDRVCFLSSFSPAFFSPV